MALVCLLLFIAVSPATAQDRTWTGDGDGTSWSDPANWTPSGVPGEHETIAISSNLSVDYTIAVASPVTVAGLSLTHNRATLSLGAPLHVTGDYLQAGATITGSGDVSVDGTLTWQGGTMSGSGSTYAQGDVRFTGSAGSSSNRKFLDGRRLIISEGSIAEYAGTSTVDGSNGAEIIIEQGATLELRTTARLITSGSGDRPVIINNGTLRTAEGNFTSNVYFDIQNSGTIEALNQALILHGGMEDASGIYRAHEGSRLDIRAIGSEIDFTPASIIEGAGEISFSGGTAIVRGTWDVTGTTDINGASNQGASLTVVPEATLLSIGSLRVHSRGSLTIQKTEPLIVNDVEVDFSGYLELHAPLSVEGSFTQRNNTSTIVTDHDIDVAGLLTWRGGTVQGTGTTYARGGVHITGGSGSGSNRKKIDGRRLLVPSGTTLEYLDSHTWEGANGAEIVVEAGASFVVSNGSLWVASGSTERPRIVNDGLFRINDGSGQIRIAFDLINRGELEVASRDVRIEGELVDEGASYRVAEGGKLSFYTTNESLTLPSHSTLEVAGHVLFSNGATAIEGTLDVSGTLEVAQTDLVVTEAADLISLAAEKLMLSTSGSLVVETSDPISVGDVDIRARGYLALNGPLTTQNFQLYTNSSEITSEHDITVEGLLTWRGGTMRGAGTTFARGGVNHIGSGSSASYTKLIDTRRLVVPAGATFRYGGWYLLEGANGAEIMIEEDATLHIAIDDPSTARMGVASGSTQLPRLRNQGMVTAEGNVNVVFRTDWDVENAGGWTLHEFVRPTFVNGFVNLGTLQGNGILTGTVHNRGVINPGVGGGGTGQITIDGLLQQYDDGAIEIEIGGTAPGLQHDQLRVDELDLAGILRLSLVNGYNPGQEDIFRAIEWPVDGRSGSFAAVEGQDEYDLGIRFSDTAVEVYDGSLSSAPGRPTVSATIDVPAYQRRFRSIPVKAAITTSGGAGVTRLRFENFEAGLHPDENCPMNDAYENLRCRMERFGVTPPEPEDGGEAYPFLTTLPFPGSLEETGDGGGGGGSSVSATGVFGDGGTLNAGGTQMCNDDSETMTVEAGRPVTDDDLAGCAYEVAKLALDFVPGYDCFKLATGIGTHIGEGLYAGQFDLTAYLAANMVGAVNCAGDAVPATKAIKIMTTLNDLASKAGGIQGVASACNIAAGEQAVTSLASASTSCIRSADPNDKVGPSGVGTRRFVTLQDTLPYVVFFENKPEATAAAQEVIISDTLDVQALDLSTFSFGMIAWSDTSISMPKNEMSVVKDVDLRPGMDLVLRINADLDETTGLLTWRFQSLDPKTLEPTPDPLAGFLPPNKDFPEGEGLVSYVVSPRPSLANGTSFGHAARIFFDENDPIDTPVWSNAIDDAPPSSAVAALDSLQRNEEFEVRWSGTDEGSGVATYTIFVSENDGPFEEWLSETADSSAVFTGVDGSRYAFYSVARDSVGFVEPKEAAPDAITEVALTPVSVGNESPLPRDFALHEPYPNPSSSQVTIGFSVPTDSHVRLSLYDALGRRVMTLVDESRPAGKHILTVDARTLAAGTYICRMQAGDFQTMRTVLVVR